MDHQKTRKPSDSQEFNTKYQNEINMYRGSDLCLIICRNGMMSLLFLQKSINKHLTVSREVYTHRTDIDFPIEISLNNDKFWILIFFS